MDVRMIERLTDAEKDVLLILHWEDEPIRFDGNFNRQLCKVLEKKELIESVFPWGSGYSHHPHYFLIEKGKFKAERLMQQGTVEWIEDDSPPMFSRDHILNKQWREVHDE